MKRYPSPIARLLGLEERVPAPAVVMEWVAIACTLAIVCMVLLVLAACTVGIVDS